MQSKQDNRSAYKTTCFNVSKEGQVIPNNACFYLQTERVYVKDSTISLSFPSESKFLNHLAVISSTKAIVKGATIKLLFFLNVHFVTSIIG